MPVTELPPSFTAAEVRAFLGMTTYLRHFVKGYSILAAPLTDIPHNKAFASKMSRLSPIPLQHQRAFFSIMRHLLTSFSILAFPVWNRPFCFEHRRQCGRRVPPWLKKTKGSSGSSRSPATDGLGQISEMELRNMSAWQCCRQ